MNSIKRIIEGWQLTEVSPNTSALFLRVLYGITFLNFLYLLPIADSVWGTDHFIILCDQWSGSFGHLAMLLNHDFYRQHYQWFLLPEMALLLLGILGWSNLFSRLLTWLLFVNLHFANPEVSNGGYHVLHQCLFFAIFFFKTDPSLNDRFVHLKRLLKNLAFYSIWVQISLVYAVAGTHKLLGNHWLAGDALFITLSIPEYSLPWIVSTIHENTWWLKIATWVTLLYQLLFPIIIWSKIARPYLLAIGFLFHLGIAMIIGVSDFGFILIAVYAVFLPDKPAQKITQWLGAIRFFRKTAGTSNMSGTGD